MFRKLITLSLLAFSLFLSGCGGSDAQEPAADQFAKNETIFGNISTAGGRTGITLTADRSSIDVANGQVLVTATVVRDSIPVSGVSVTFTIKAPSDGPAAIEPGLTTVVTDSNGMAMTRVSAGNFLTTSNVIVQGTATMGAQSALATTTFQLVRGSGVIMFTDKAGTAPGGQDNMLEPYEIKGVDPAITPSVAVLQLLPFKVTDSNGNPRVGVPITLSVYSISGQAPEDVTVDFLVDPTAEPNARTITTDSAGTGIFNVAVRLETPPLGSFNAASIVFKATTNDAIPVTAYVGGSYSITAKEPAAPAPAPAQ